MGRTWKKLDLRGAGLQALNARLTRRLKRPLRAYLLWVLFPLGVHRLYLKSPLGAAVYAVLTASSLLLWRAFGPAAALAAAGPEAALALFDLIRIERRCTALNKALRMELYLGAGAAPPEGYRGRDPDDDYLGRYVREKEGERAGHVPPGAAGGDPARGSRVPSFQEQERLLRELARRRDRDAKGGSGGD